MAYLDSISVVTGAGAKSVDLYHDDLVSMRSPVDLLIISASAQDYSPTSGSIIGALHRKHIHVAQLAMTREIYVKDDDNFVYWLSGEIDAADAGARFKRILCIEPPLHHIQVDKLARRVYQALVSILSRISSIKTVATPVLFSGGAGLSVLPMFEELVDGAVHWMALGMPLERFKIVVYDKTKAKQAAEKFAVQKSKHRTTPLQARATITHDAFISYATANRKDLELVLRYLRREHEGIRVFVDSEGLVTGTVWQHRLFMALDSCRKVVALISPDYVSSEFCIEEFNIAMLRGRSEGQDILYPVYLYKADLPTYFRARQLLDCREGDRVKIKAMCKSLVRDLGHSER